MKVISAMLRMLTLKVHITVSVMTGVDADETWMHGDWFYTTDTDYGIIGHEVKARKVSTRQSYTMDNYTVQRFYKKGH